MFPPRSRGFSVSSADAGLVVSSGVLNKRPEFVPSLSPMLLANGVLSIVVYYWIVEVATHEVQIDI